METCVACLLHTPHGQLMQPAQMLELLDSPDAGPLLQYLSWLLGKVGKWPLPFAIWNDSGTKPFASILTSICTYVCQTAVIACFQLQSPGNLHLLTSNYE